MAQSVYKCLFVILTCVFLARLFKRVLYCIFCFTIFGADFPVSLRQTRHPYHKPFKPLHIGIVQSGYHLKKSSGEELQPEFPYLHFPSITLNV